MRPGWKPGRNDAGALCVLAALTESLEPRTVAEIEEAARRELPLNRLGYWYFDVSGRIRRGLRNLVAAGLVKETSPSRFEITPAGMDFLQERFDEEARA